jgi:hypothetical protein
MKKLCPHLTNLGITVLDLTKKGWTPTEANILALANEIREIPDTSNIPVIMDLLGNFAFRYEQSDGTQPHTNPLCNKFFETGFRRNKRPIAFLLPPPALPV